MDQMWLVLLLLTCATSVDLLYCNYHLLQIVLPFCPAQAGSLWDVKHFLWAASPHFSHSTPCKNKCLSQSRHLDGVLNRWKVCVFALSDIVRPAELPAPVEKLEWQFGEIVVESHFVSEVKLYQFSESYLDDGQMLEDYWTRHFHCPLD